jgi:hypothetical protein
MNIWLMVKPLQLPIRTRSGSCRVRNEFASSSRMRAMTSARVECILGAGPPRGTSGDPFSVGRAPLMTCSPSSSSCLVGCSDTPQSFCSLSFIFWAWEFLDLLVLYRLSCFGSRRRPIRRFISYTRPVKRCSLFDILSSRASYLVSKAVLADGAGICVGPDWLFDVCPCAGAVLDWS